MKDEKTKGRGRKQCPKCLIFLGVRTKLCPCGFDFYSPEYSSPANNAAEKKKVEVVTVSNSEDYTEAKLTNEQKFVALHNWNPRKLHYAIGDSQRYPTLKGETQKEVDAWCSECMKMAPLSPGALKNILLHHGVHKQSVLDCIDVYAKFKEEEAGCLAE